LQVALLNTPAAAGANASASTSSVSAIPARSVAVFREPLTDMDERRIASKRLLAYI
jgi:hypothetical protein